MEHFDIEDMFGKRKKPKLVVDCKLLLRSHGVNRDRKHVTLHALIYIKNEGRGTAKFPFLSLLVHRPYKIATYELDGNGNSGLPRVTPPRSSPAKYAAGANTVIHPGITWDVTKIDDITVPIPATSEPTSLVIDYEISAEDTELTRGQIVIDGEEILDFAESKAL